MLKRQLLCAFLAAVDETTPHTDEGYRDDRGIVGWSAFEEPPVFCITTAAHVALDKATIPHIPLFCREIDTKIAVNIYSVNKLGCETTGTDV
jgi:hypothetical protein